MTVRLHNGTARGGHAEGDTFASTETVEHTGLDGNTMAREVTDIEHLAGSRYDDILAGDLKDNRIEGFDGNDVLYGGPLGGDDQLFGSGGNDRLYGGIGDDIFFFAPPDCWGCRRWGGQTQTSARVRRSGQWRTSSWHNKGLTW